MKQWKEGRRLSHRWGSSSNVDGLSLRMRASTVIDPDRFAFPREARNVKAGRQILPQLKCRSDVNRVTPPRVVRGVKIALADAKRGLRNRPRPINNVADITNYGFTNRSSLCTRSIREGGGTSLV